MAVEEVVRQGWFSRLKSSLAGVVIGLILIAAAAVLQFWNEGRTLRQQRMLEAARAEVVSVPSDGSVAAAGKLVHLVGSTRAEGQRLDPLFNQVADGIALRRRVEMYQWKERRETREETELGGAKVTRTIYHYDRVWSDDHIDHRRFKEPYGHENPPELPFASERWRADRVDLGAFRLGEAVVAEIGGWKPMAADLDRLPPNLAAAFGRGGDHWLSTSQGSAKVGDLRVAFERIPDGEISVVARARGLGQQPEVDLAGAGLLLDVDRREQGELLLLERGQHSAEQMFDAAERRNAGLGWALRLLGFVLMWVGFAALFSPLAVFADVLPIAGRFTRWVNALLSGVLAATISFIAIASGWLFHRPWLLALAVLGLAAGIYALLRRRPAPLPPPLPSTPPPPPPPGGGR